MGKQVLPILAVIIFFTAFSINVANALPLQSKVTLSLSGVIQQTQTGTYTFVISVSGSNYQMKNGATQQIVFQSTNAAQVANAAIGNLTANQKILFMTGTYTLTSSIEINNKDNGSLVFQPGAKLFVANGMGKSAIFIHDGSDNWVIDGVEIDGNVANQALGGWSPPDGIAVYNHCSNILVEGATINNVRMYGFVAWEDVTNSGIINSKVTNCGWNGIQLGADSNNEHNLYAINNEVAFISDVGITNFGVGNLVQGNYIHDMTGTTGYINSQWGIGVEGGHGHTITGNTIVNAPRAMWIQHTDGVGSNIITNNTITTCGFGIATVSPNNTISNNTISGFDMYGWGQQAIVVDGGYGGANYNKVLNNTISSAGGVAHAVLINSADNTQFNYNRINVPRVGTSWFAVQVSSSSFTVISRNTIVGFMGVIVGDSACQSTTISYNDFTQSNAQPGAIENDGTGTIITGNLT
jgi:parallel beta-helix repeat protein